jgi:hypothetical protein
MLITGIVAFLLWWAMIAGWRRLRARGLAPEPGRTL